MCFVNSHQPSPPKDHRDSGRPSACTRLACASSYLGVESTIGPRHGCNGFLKPLRCCPCLELWLKGNSGVRGSSLSMQSSGCELATGYNVSRTKLTECEYLKTWCGIGLVPIYLQFPGEQRSPTNVD